MAKVVRHSYPKEISVGLILLVFVLTFFLSGQLFEKYQPQTNEFLTINVGKALISLAVVIMVMILWEELFFPVKVFKPAEGGAEFRNHRTKLKIQALIYLSIPVIIAFIFITYEVNIIRFILWALVVAGAPVAGKLISGINNYNDFLKLTDHHIEYKNNEEVGNFPIASVKQIVLIKDETKVLHKIQVDLADKQVIIDLDEMELESYYEAIEGFITEHYKGLVK